jgi:hypothetical protein
VSDFFTKYMEYVALDEQEAPAIYHRWTLASIVGALLGRQFYLPFGKGVIYPNQYVMLMGPPGTGKGVAMGIGKGLLQGSGYNRFSASKTSPERFLKDMKKFDVNPNSDLADIEALVLEGPSETYVFAPEFVDFIGESDKGFINLLTNLWDNLDVYTHPKLHGASVTVDMPTINMLGGSTAQTFSIAFPPEVIGTGFLARLLLIHSDPTGKMIEWPELEDPLHKAQMILHVKEIRDKIKGEAAFSQESRELLLTIRKKCILIDDSRFSHYHTRRHMHLLKLAMIIAAANLSTEIKPIHILQANTMLVSAEKGMPKALGEFGKNKNSEVANDILAFLSGRNEPASMQQLFKIVSRSVRNMPELTEIMHNLLHAEKVQTISMKGKSGFMIKHVQAPEWDPKLLVPGWLTDEERIV